MKTLIILNFVTRELCKFNFNKENFSKENFGKENFSKENFGKVPNFAEVEEVKKAPNFAEVEDIQSFIRSIKKLSRISIFISSGEAH